jgi:Tol biopolymer transport system component
MKNADGAQEEKSFVRDDFNKYPNDWSRGGKYILYTRGPDLWFVTVPAPQSSLYLKAVSILRNGQFSPDGRWVAMPPMRAGSGRSTYLISGAAGQMAGLGWGRRTAPLAK